MTVLTYVSGHARFSNYLASLACPAPPS